jgi:hypothetical protein
MCLARNGSPGNRIVEATCPGSAPMWILIYTPPLTFEKLKLERQEHFQPGELTEYPFLQKVAQDHRKILRFTQDDIPR